MNTQITLIAVFVAILGATMTFSPVMAQMQVPQSEPSMVIPQGEDKPTVKVPFKPVLPPSAVVDDGPVAQEPIQTIQTCPPLCGEEPEMVVPQPTEPPMVVPDVKPVEEKCVCEENAIVIPVNVTEESKPIIEDTEEAVTDVVETVVNATEDDKDDKANALIELLKALVRNDSVDDDLFESEREETEDLLEQYIESIEE